MLDKLHEIKAYKEFNKLDPRFKFLDEQYHILSESEIKYQTMLEEKRGELGCSPSYIISNVLCSIYTWILIALLIVGVLVI